MANRTIDVIVHVDGAISIDAVGFSGPDCQRATHFLEKALGQIAVQRTKPDYHQRTVATRTQTVTQ